jgi:butyryl-CoA dehydrogenase
MDFAISTTQADLREGARAFGRKEVFPSVLERDGAARWDSGLFKKLGEAGLLGAPYPEEYGGTNLSCLETCLVAEGFSEGGEDGGLTLAWQAHTILCGVPIWKLGTEAQKRRYLPKMCTGEWVGGFCLSEPDHGSDATGMKTRAVKKGDRWILNGRKMWITNGVIGNHFIVTAVTDPGMKAAGISTFIVEKDFPGFRVGQVIHKLGMKTSTTAELVFEDCEVPEENLLGEENFGFIGTARLILGWERSTLLAPVVGGMRAILDRSVRYAQDRIQFDRPIGKFQAVRMMLADMKVRPEIASNLIYRVAWQLDSGDDSPPLVDAAIAKVYASEAAQKSARDAIQIHGGNGFTPEYHVERFYRDCMLGTIGGGTSEIQRSIIARSLLDLGF